MPVPQGHDALVNLFEHNDEKDFGVVESPVIRPSHQVPGRSYGNLRMRKPRALTVSSASSTTFLDQSCRGRSPCGRFHRARVIQSTLRNSFPVDNQRAVTEPIPKAPHPTRHASSRLNKIRRMFSLKRHDESSPPLKPLYLPATVAKERPESSDSHINLATILDLNFSKTRAHLVRRLSLGNWLPTTLLQKPKEALFDQFTTPRKRSDHLRPLVLSPKSSPIIPQTSGVDIIYSGAEVGEHVAMDAVPPVEKGTNILAWLLECIQSDLPPVWTTQTQEPEVQKVADQQMLLHDGQPRCLVVRTKRRSALF